MLAGGRLQMDVAEGDTVTHGERRKLEGGIWCSAEWGRKDRLAGKKAKAV